ncbi:hypothetical protein BDZ89DRAFT_1051653 [Hymenopellis radicata]|nr:hypothetical protein BDZ89DRAFT_1051653 [Hymenopellis radicata]
MKSFLVAVFPAVSVCAAPFYHEHSRSELLATFFDEEISVGGNTVTFFDDIESDSVKCTDPIGDEERAARILDLRVLNEFENTTVSLHRKFGSNNGLLYRFDRVFARHTKRNYLIWTVPP